MVFMTLTQFFEFKNFEGIFEFCKYLLFFFDLLSINPIDGRSLMLLIGNTFIDLIFLFKFSAFYYFDTNCFQE